jgi:hypothetical protein
VVDQRIDSNRHEIDHQELDDGPQPGHGRRHGRA